MMSGNIMLKSLRLMATRSSSIPLSVRPMSSYAEIAKHRIGQREVVGFGHNGQPMYIDRYDFPMPAIRYKEETPEIKLLREKEKGDWKKLTIQEKKALYRASYCQTFAELGAPTGEWKSIVGYGLMFISAGLWFHLFINWLIYGPLPESCSEESQRAQLKRIIDQGTNPVLGISSKWDYEKNDWKK